MARELNTSDALRVETWAKPRPEARPEGAVERPQGEAVAADETAALRPDGRAPVREASGTNVGRGDVSPSSSRGLLVTADRRLARAFQRELRRCAECTLPLDVRSTCEEAVQDADGAYRWVAVDLDGAMGPSEAVRLARRAWPAARIAVLSCWWSERDAIARELAEVVIHKPVRSPELLAFLRASAGAPQREVLPAATG